MTMVNHPNRSKQQQAKHTPGPWTVEYEPNARDEPGATFVLREANDRFDTNEANARLIAAAPELLAALKTVEQASSEIERNLNTGVLADFEALLNFIRAAIAKCEGR